MSLACCRHSRSSIDHQSSKKFGEYVSQLFIRVDKCSDNVSRLELSSYKMTTHLNMFGPLIDRLEAKCNVAWLSRTR